MGGSFEFIQTGSTSLPDAWISAWSDRGESEKPYRVVYGPVAVDQPVRPVLPVSGARNVLAAAIDDAASLARRARSGFAESFEAARRALESPEPRSLYYADMLPGEGYGLRERQLLAATTQASVLGGAGSWNDQSPEIEASEGYWDITAALSVALLDAELSVANALATE